MKLAQGITSKLPFLSKFPKVNLFSKTNLIIIFIVLGCAVIWLLFAQTAIDLQIFGYKPFAKLITRVVISVIYGAALACVVAVWLFKLLKKDATQDEDKPADKQAQADDITKQQAYLDTFLQQLQKRLRTKNFHYKLPWYLLIGDTSSGKSSLLRESCRLNDLCSADDVRVKCYLSEQAVIIDIKGDLFNGSSASNEHKLLLNLLDWCKDVRTRQPINGIILTVDVYKLSTTNKQQQETYLATLVARMRDVLQTLQVKLPIYIVLSKIDLLFGFNAMYGHLNQKERMQIMGITFKLNCADFRSDLDHFWHNLLERLNIKLPTLMLNNASKRASLFSFVKQLHSIKDHVLQLVDELVTNVDNDDLMLRGVYLTSALQQGQMDNLFVAAASAQYNLPKQIYPSHQTAHSKPYFVQNLFDALLFKEAHLASKNLQYQKLYKNKLYLGGALSATTALVALGTMHYYFKQNYNASTKTLDKVYQYVNNLKSNNANNANDDMQLQLLNPLYDALMAYSNYQNRLPIIADLGLYQGYKVAPIVDEAYLKILQQHFLPRIMHLLNKELDNSPSGSEQKLNILRIMRMIEDETRRDNNMVLAYMQQYWSEHFTGQKDKQQQLYNHLLYALEHIKWKKARNSYNKLAQESFMPFKLGIEKAQLELSTRPVYQRVYQNIRSQSKTVLLNDLNIKQHIGTGFAAVFAVKGENTLEISQFLTKMGLSGYFVNQANKLAQWAALDNWVLNITTQTDYSESDKQEIERKITNLYLNDYISTWDLAYSSIHIKQFADIADAISALEQIIGAEQVFKKAIILLKENTSIIELPKIAGASENAGVALDLVTSNLPENKLLAQVNRKFKIDTNMVLDSDESTSILNNVDLQIGELHRYLLAIYSAPDLGVAALKAVQMHVNNNDPIFEGKKLAKTLPPIYGRWLRELCDEVWHVVLLQAAQALEAQWQESVISQYKLYFAERYPFKADAKQMVPLSEFERFFAYDGILANFYQQNLKIFIDNNLTSADLDKKLISKEVLQQLERAEKIRRTYFSKQNGLGISFSLQPIAMSGNVRSGILNLDGQLIEYKHSKHKAVNLIWPNSMRSNIQSKLSLSTKDNRVKTLTYEGAWGLIKLINSGKLTNVNKDNFDVRYDLDNNYITYRIFIDEADNPFDGKLFKQFSLPDTLY